MNFLFIVKISNYDYPEDSFWMGKIMAKNKAEANSKINHFIQENSFFAEYQNDNYYLSFDIIENFSFETEFKGSTILLENIFYH